MKETAGLQKTEKRENNLSPREKLLSFEKEGKFVFHGSARQIETLEPRQPCIGKDEKHGDPCVATTPFVDIAIFRAIINEDNFPQKTYSSSFGFDSDKGIELHASQIVLDNLKDKKGFVYALDKSLFKKFSGMEWRSEKTIKPNEVILVTADDLPSGIKLIDKDFNPAKNE